MTQTVFLRRTSGLVLEILKVGGPVPIRHLTFGCIAFIVAGCAAATGTLPDENSEPENSWHAVSNDRVYEVRIMPESGEIEIGPIHNWIINVREVEGDPVFPARISVGGGMSGHGHGLPTQPLVTAYGGNGDYLVEGVRFNMDGMWRLSFIIESHSGRDIVNFNISVDY